MKDNETFFVIVFSIFFIAIPILIIINNIKEENKKQEIIKYVYDNKDELLKYINNKNYDDPEELNKFEVKIYPNEEKGYIDDVKYTHSKVTSMKAALMGERRIIKDLKTKGIDEEIIAQVFEELKEEDEETANAIRYANKIQHQIKDKSLRKTKMMIAQKLYAQGFTQEITQKALQALSFEDEMSVERKVLRQLATKAKQRYEKKYSGVELRNRVFRYCSSQGFEIDDIYLVLSEMEWENEH